MPGSRARRTHRGKREMKNLRLAWLSGLLLLAFLVAPLAVSVAASGDIKKVKGWEGSFAVHFNQGADSQPIDGYKGTMRVTGSFVLDDFMDDSPYLTWSGTSKAIVITTDGKSTEIADGEAWLSLDMDTGTYSLKFGDFPYSAKWKGGGRIGAVELMTEERPIPKDFKFITFSGPMETEAGVKPVGFAFKPTE